MARRGLSPTRILAIAKQDLRVLRTDYVPVVALILMPLVLMPFLQPAFDLALRVEGYREATGAEQAVPGMAVTFAFFLVGNLSFGFLREHAWNTWERLRASPASTTEILLGKLVVPLLEAAAQFVCLFGLGGILLDLHVRGSWLALIAVGGSFSLFLVTTGLAVTALCRSFMQVNVIVYIGTLLLAGLAGALVPFGLLPHWAQDVAPASPSYWAMQGYKHAIFGHGSVLAPVLVLLGFSALAGLFTSVRFRVDESKIGFV